MSEIGVCLLRWLRSCQQRAFEPDNGAPATHGTARLRSGLAASNTDDHPEPVLACAFAFAFVQQPHGDSHRRGPGEHARLSCRHGNG